MLPELKVAILERRKIGIDIEPELMQKDFCTECWAWGDWNYSVFL